MKGFKKRQSRYTCKTGLSYFYNYKTKVYCLLDSSKYNYVNKYINEPKIEFKSKLELNNFVYNLSNQYNIEFYFKHDNTLYSYKDYYLYYSSSKQTWNASPNRESIKYKKYLNKAWLLNIKGLLKFKTLDKRYLEDNEALTRKEALAKLETKLAN